MRGDFTRSTFDPGKRYSGVRLQQGRVQLDADWNEQVDIDAHLRETGVRDLIGPCGAPIRGGGFEITATADGKDLNISAGRFYVDGILCELAEPASYLQQPDLPEPPAAQAGVHFVYLDVWRHHVTALEDPAIRETALGGPDTATRTRTVCQVRLLRVGEASESGRIDCSSNPEPWRRLTAPRQARMRARTQEGTIPTDPCIVPADSGYTRLENQLYRIEIHRGGALGEATCKWSIENGSVVTAWTAQSGNELTVESAGRDRVLGFSEGDWVELTDEGRELRGEPGLLVQITGVEGNVLTVDPGGQAIARADFPLQPKVRRWDSEGERTVEAPAANGGWIDIGNGIEIRFEGDGFRTGDSWLIPARAFIGGNGGEIEWPRQGADWLPKPPDGIEHHLCKLAVATFNDGVFRNLLDCRPQFPALTELPRAEEVESLRVQRVLLASTREPLENDSRVPLANLARGLRIFCSAPLAEEPFARLDGANPALVPPKPTCTVALDLPYPLDANESETLFADGFIGFQRTVLASTVTVRETEIFWQPERQVAAWLSERFRVFMERRQITPVLAHLVLKGNAIWQRDRPDVFLDGNAFGRPQDGRVGLTLPSGDGRRGGDFEMWFWLEPGEPPVRGIQINAQGLLNQIAGTVVDAATGAGVAGAVVTLTGPSNMTRTTTTTTDGQFRILDLSFATYTLRAQARDGSVATTTVTLAPILVRPTRPVGDIPGVGTALGGRLTQAGITTANQVAEMEPARLAQVLGLSEDRARVIIDSAKRLVES